jgi:hypothetical protein
MRGKARPDGNQRARLPEPLIDMPLTDEQHAELEVLGYGRNGKARRFAMR